MHQAITGEFLGTAILVLLGDGVVAGTLLRGSKGEGAGWLAITAGWAFAVTCGVLTALAAGAPGHLNPAITLFAALASGDYWPLATEVPAQLLGGAVGAALVWLCYRPLYARTDDPDLKLATFCTMPATDDRLASWTTEAMGAFVLALVATAISLAHPAPALAPVLVGLVVWGIGLGLGGMTGYAINPARDLGPRIMHALLPIPGKGQSGWAYAPTPVIAPLLGVLLAMGVLRLFAIQ